MQDKPLLSVICITYNHEKFIAQALNGFLIQKTSFPIEIWVHDDASTDRTADIVLEYAQKYPHLIKPILQKENQHSKGKKITPIVTPYCQGKYIALCEADDYWGDPYKLQKQVDFLESNPDYVMCFHDATIIDESGRAIKARLGEHQKKDLSALELRKNPPAYVLQVVFRNVFLKIEFPKEMSYALHGDTFLISMLGQFGKGKYLSNMDSSAACYRLHDGGVWSKKRLAVGAAAVANSYAWLSKYYKRISDEEVAEHFRMKFLEITLGNLVEKPYYGSRSETVKKVVTLLKAHIDIIDDTHLERFIRHNTFHAYTVGLWKDIRRYFIGDVEFGKWLRRFLNKYK